VEFGEPVDWPLADLGRVDGRRAQDGRVCEGARHQTVTEVKQHMDLSIAFSLH